MLVTCKSVSGSDIPLSSRRKNETGHRRYDNRLTIGQSYDVDAILIFNERSEYLINTEEEDRSALYFFPSCLFTVKSHVMEKDWHFVDLRTIESYSEHCDQFGMQYLIGYKEMVESSDHFQGLILGEEKDILIYLNYKKTALNEKKILLKEELALKHQNDGWEDWSAR